ADTAKESVFVITVEHLREVRLVGLEVADDANDDRVALGDFEHPEVILDPGTRLDFDGAHNPEWQGQAAIARRQRRFHRNARRARVRRSLRSGGIEEVNMSVYDRNR